MPRSRSKENLNDPNLMTPKKNVTEPVTNQSPAGEQNEDEVKDEKREEQQGQATEQDEDETWNFEKPKEEAEEQDEEPTGEVPEQFKDVPDKPETQPEEPEQATEQDDKDIGDKDDGDKDNGDKDEVEYEGENYRLLKINESTLKGNVIEYNNKFYTPLKIKERIGESDIDYEGTVYRPRTNSLIEYNGKLYQKEAENPHTDTDPDQDHAGRGTSNNEQDQARPLELPAEEEVSVSGPPAGTEPTVIEDELKKTGENIVIKTRKGYRRLQVYEADTTTSKLENLKNRGLKKDDKKDDKESKKKA